MAKLWYVRISLILSIESLARFEVCFIDKLTLVIGGIYGPLFAACLRAYISFFSCFLGGGIVVYMVICLLYSHHTFSASTVLDNRVPYSM